MLETLISLMTSKIRQEAIREEGMRFAGQFTWEKCVSETLEAYSEI